MPRRRPGLRRSPVRLLATVLGLLAALALGAADLHDTAAEHVDGGLRAVQVSEGASHPRDAQHVETSQIKLHPGCSACLLELQLLGSALPARLGLPVPAPTAASPSLPRIACVAAVTPVGSPRAPPVSPVLL